MENQKTHQEEIKAEKFFERVWNKSVSKAVSWFLVGICVFLIMILCTIPAQNFSFGTEDSPMLMPITLSMITYLAVSARLSPYNQYNENQKSRFVTDILKYHPISKKAIWKVKTKTMVIFLGKVSAVGLGIQLLASFLSYKSVSLENFVYIIGFLFVIPVGCEIGFDLVAKKVGE